MLLFLQGFFFGNKICSFFFQFCIPGGYCCFQRMFFIGFFFLLLTQIFISKFVSFSVAAFSIQ
jgi:hypothetical protein